MKRTVRDRTLQFGVEDHGISSKVDTSILLRPEN